MLEETFPNMQFCIAVMDQMLMVTVARGKDDVCAIRLAEDMNCQFVLNDPFRDRQSDPRINPAHRNWCKSLQVTSSWGPQGPFRER